MGTEQARALARGTIATLTAMVLTACGGGGGGDDGGLGPVVEAPPIQINAQNAPTLAVQALDAGGAGVGAGLSLVSGVQVQTAPTPAPAPLAAAGRLVRLLLPQRAPALAVGATTRFNEPCSFGGSVSVTVSYASADVVTAGDALSLNATDCAEAEGTINGKMRLVANQGTADGLYIDGNLTFTGFSVSSGGLREQVDGTVRFIADERDATQTVIRVSTDQLRTQQFVNGALRSARTLFDQDYLLSESTATFAKSESFAYGVTGSFQLLGTVSWRATTTQDLFTPANAVYPTRGAVRVSGANGQTMSLTVITSNGGGVRVELTGAAPVEYTWAQLDALR